MSLLGAMFVAGISAQQMPPKKPRIQKPAVKHEQVVEIGKQDGSEMCVGGYVVWADGTISKCEVVK